MLGKSECEKRAEAEAEAGARGALRPLGVWALQQRFACVPGRPTVGGHMDLHHVAGGADRRHVHLPYGNKVVKL